MPTDVWRMNACQRGIELFSPSCYVNTPTGSFVWSAACCSGFILVVASYSTHGPFSYTTQEFRIYTVPRQYNMPAIFTDSPKFTWHHFSACNGFGVRRGEGFGRWRTREETLRDLGGGGGEIWPDRVVMKWKKRDWKVKYFEVESFVPVLLWCCFWQQMQMLLLWFAFTQLKTSAYQHICQQLLNAGMKS